jgi:protein-S-isoprenylcysteine O-methyltransferase Ste14
LQTSGPKFLVLLFANLLLSFAIAVTVLFLTAGSFRFWQAWVYLAVVFTSSISIGAYFYRYDRPLFDRRLQKREKSRRQKLLRRIFTPIFAMALVLSALDHRLGWSRDHLGGVPLWLVALSDLVVLGGYLVAFRAMKVNSFASSTIQVENGQTIISSGPYAVVRHPFYTGCLMIMLFSAPALGSYFAWPVFVLYVLFFVLRLLDEEKLLRQELPGYADYCLRTPFRLVPHVW